MDRDRLQDYRIIKGKDLDQLRREIKNILPVGYIPVGDIGYYYDEKLKSNIFYQAVYKEMPKT